ncbi:allantoinase [Irpex rosettiformis]|uniref:Allantoinase n=1 Tax=Irpex rosettiformis TaxID=378272 RepID=A0ACB8U3U0_9APHY|nr:allantoinase [Irpex rosettiformis]
MSIAGKVKVFTGSNVVLPGQSHGVPATLVANVESGQITEIHAGQRSRQEFLAVSDSDWLDAGDKLILPGLVDSHVHLNEPGRTEWEGFYTGTRAAASGGVTTVVDMPLNSIPPTVTLNYLEVKRKAATGQCAIDVAFWGGVIPGNQSHLKPLVASGVKGFKCFLIESGVEEFPCVARDDLVDAMDELKDTSTVLCFHAELEGSQPDVSEDDPTLYSTFLASRPQELEVNAIKLITSLHTQYPSLRLHIVHLSAANALPLIRAAKTSGLPLTVETCFHYLALSAAEIPHGHPEFKCCPPIREETNRDALWGALLDGTIDCVVSDHSPCVASLKRCEEGDIMSAWGGISTLGLGLSVLWTEGQKRGVTIGQIVDWLSVKTAMHAGLDDRKGKLAVGYDADIVVFDPNTDHTVTKESLNFKNKLSPYEGLTLKGRVEKTFLRGNLVYDVSRGFVTSKPLGQLL